MSETDANGIVLGQFIDSKGILDQFSLSSTLRLRSALIDREKLWQSKDRSAEFMGDIWSLFVDPEVEERISTVLHSVCVELIENAVKFGQKDYHYIIIVELYLKDDELLVEVINTCDRSKIPELERSARLVLESRIPLTELFTQLMKEAKRAKKAGQNKSQVGFVQILMQGARLAWKIEPEEDTMKVTTQAIIPLKRKES